MSEYLFSAHKHCSSWKCPNLELEHFSFSHRGRPAAFLRPQLVGLPSVFHNLRQRHPVCPTWPLLYSVLHKLNGLCSRPLILLQPQLCGKRGATVVLFCNNCLLLFSVHFSGIHPEFLFWSCIHLHSPVGSHFLLSPPLPRLDVYLCCLVSH